MTRELPAWVTRTKKHFQLPQDINRMHDALSIAWDGLHKADVMLRCLRIDGTVEAVAHLQSAMRRIKEMGG